MHTFYRLGKHSVFLPQLPFLFVLLFCKREKIFYKCSSVNQYIVITKQPSINITNFSLSYFCSLLLTSLAYLNQNDLFKMYKFGNYRKILYYIIMSFKQG